MGDNGAGKSTLVKCVGGAIQPDSGVLEVLGEEYAGYHASKAKALGIEVVYQDLSLVDTLSVSQNFFLNRELKRQSLVGKAIGWLDKGRMRRVTHEQMSALGIELDNEADLVRVLSGGQRQMVAVARAVAWGGRIVIMDEPSAALGVVQAARVVEVIRRLAGEGTAVILITHDIQQVLQVTDRILVLRHGSRAGEVVTAQTTANEIVSLITGAHSQTEGH